MNSKNLKSIKFWGASTSAHQVEGKNHNQWTVWELEHAAELAAGAEAKYGPWLPSWSEVKSEATKPENYVSGIAVDHYHRYEEDFDIAKNLNLNAYRFSIEWSRVQPEIDRWDEKEIEHYRSVIKALKKRGIEPMICLWHWTMPIWFVELGAFEFKANIEYWLKFCEKVAAELGEHFTYLLTLNEPNVYTGLSYGRVDWPPQANSTWRALKVYRNLIKAHKRAYTVLKTIRKDFKIGIAQHIDHFYVGDDSPISNLVVKLRAWFWNWYFFERSKLEHDFIGINYYMSDRVFGIKTDNPDEHRNDLGWNMEPANIEHVVMAAYLRYGRPVIVTENGVADSKDQYRQWWLEETLGGLSRAIGRGAQVDGYVHWSLMDNFEWADGFWPHFGLVEIDRETMTRKVRPSAKWYARTLQTFRSDSEDR